MKIKSKNDKKKEQIQKKTTIIILGVAPLLSKHGCVHPLVVKLLPTNIQTDRL